VTVSAWYDVCLCVCAIGIRIYLQSTHVCVCARVYFCVCVRAYLCV